jgi:hypothetical protein
MSDKPSQEAKTPKILPKPNSDFYQTFEMLSEAEQATVSKVREFMKATVAPIIQLSMTFGRKTHSRLT